MFTIEAARATSVYPAFAIGFPCASNTVTPGVIVAVESTTKSFPDIFTADTAVPVVVLNVTVGEASRERVAVATFEVFALLPNVHRAAARPFAPVATEAGETVPPPLVTENVTVAPETTFPN